MPLRASAITHSKILDLVHLISRLLVRMRPIEFISAMSSRQSSTLNLIFSTSPPSSPTKNSPLQRLHRSPRHIFANAQSLNPCLLNSLQLSNLPNVRICRIPRAELASAERSPSTLCIAARPGVAASARGKDGRLTGFDGRCWSKEDELESSRCCKRCRHCEEKVSSTWDFLRRFLVSASDHWHISAVSFFEMQSTLL